MRKLLTIIVIALLPTLSYAQAPWDKIITTYESEMYIDSTQIVKDDNKIYARVKTVYITPEGKERYKNNIKKVFKKKADKKIKKWQDFEYTITHGLYDCSNNRFKVMEIEDYDHNGKLIVKTKKKEEDAKWLIVNLETVGDYYVFSICDYENR